MDDVRALLSSVADDVSGVTPPTDLVLRGRRRARGRAHVVAVAAALAVAAAVTLVPRATAPQPAAPTCRAGAPTSEQSCTPATEPRTGLARYAAGGRLLAGALLTGQVGDTRTFTFTPTSWDLAVATRCSPVTSGGNIDVEVNGRTAIGATGACGATMRDDLGRAQAFWQRLGVRLGQPSTVTVRASGVLNMLEPRPTTRSATHDPAQDAVVRVGVYQDVPRADYPFPAAPAVVSAPPGLTKQFNGGPWRELARVQLPEPNGTWTHTFATREGLALYAAAGAPGAFQVSVDGVLVGGRSFWTYGKDPSTAYSMTEYALHLDPGHHPLTAKERGPVTVTVVTTGFRYPAWTVQLGHVG